MRLGFVVRVRVLVCDSMYFSGDSTPVLANHSIHFDLSDPIAVGMEQMQRNFKPMVDQIGHWRAARVTDDFPKLIIYRAFVEDQLDCPKHLAKVIHREYFEPAHPDLRQELNGAITTPSPQHSKCSDSSRSSRRQQASESSSTRRNHDYPYRLRRLVPRNPQTRRRDRVRGR